MKAARLTGRKRIEIQTVPEPKLNNANEVLLRIKAVGLCGSDVHYFCHGRIGDQQLQYPFTVGHECAAVVERTGAAVTRLSVGDRVAIDPAVSCRICDQCRAGRPHTCRNLLFLGCPGQLEGCLSEFIVMPEKNCYLLPETMNFTQGVLSEPLAIGIYAVEFLRHKKVKNIGILGTGPIGLSVLLAARAAGVKSIYATDKIASRQTYALNAGAVWVGNPDRSDIAKEILDKTQGLDAVFECCGDQSALDQAAKVLNSGGILLILGIPEIDRISFDISKLRRQELIIQNIRRQNDTTQKALGQIANKKIHVDFMATHEFPLEKCQDAFDTVAEYKDGVIKALITF